jgi:hypothetical protein
MSSSPVALLPRMNCSLGTQAVRPSPLGQAGLQLRTPATRRNTGSSNLACSFYDHIAFHFLIEPMKANSHSHADGVPRRSCKAGREAGTLLECCGTSSAFRFRAFSRPTLRVNERPLTPVGCPKAAVPLPTICSHKGLSQRPSRWAGREAGRQAAQSVSSRGLVCLLGAYASPPRELVR